jgi:cell division transport system permease protein
MTEPAPRRNAQNAKAPQTRQPPAAPPERKRPEMRVRPTGPIVPSSNIQGNALIVVIAIMAFLACLTLGAVSMVRATAASWGKSDLPRDHPPDQARRQP